MRLEGSKGTYPVFPKKAEIIPENTLWPFSNPLWTIFPVFFFSMAECLELPVKKEKMPTATKITANDHVGQFPMEL